MRAKQSPYVVGLREIPPAGLVRTFDLSGDFARSALAETEAKPETAKASATIEFHRSGEEVVARGPLTGTVTVVCSRCVGPAEAAIAVKIEVLFLPADSDVRESDAPDQPDIVIYHPGEDQLDLEPTFREELLLGLPYAPLCRESCKGLCATCGKDLNEGPCTCSDSPTDDRFASLRHLKV